MQQNRAPPPTAPPSVPVPSSPVEEAPLDHAHLVVEPPLAEVPSLPPTLPSPMQSSPKGEVDALSSSSSSSCNSDKITAVASQPSSFGSSFSTGWVSADPAVRSVLNISGLSIKSNGEGEEEGHFTAVTAQLPPPPLSDFYDRKFSSLDAFFSEYGRTVSGRVGYM